MCVRACVSMCGMCDCIGCMYEIVDQDRKGVSKTRIIPDHLITTTDTASSRLGAPSM